MPQARYTPARPTRALRAAQALETGRRAQAVDAGEASGCSIAVYPHTRVSASSARTHQRQTRVMLPAVSYPTPEEWDEVQRIRTQQADEQQADEQLRPAR